MNNLKAMCNYYCSKYDYIDELKWEENELISYCKADCETTYQLMKDIWKISIFARIKRLIINKLPTCIFKFLGIKL